MARDEHHLPAVAAHERPHTVRYAEFLDSRPPAAEVTAISTVIAAARATGCRTHIVHLSAAEALPLIARARADGAWSLRRRFAAGGRVSFVVRTGQDLLNVPGSSAVRPTLLL